ncbi:MAG: nucleoside phosphorylase [Xanthobacteraceae bacterium]
MFYGLSAIVTPARGGFTARLNSTKEHSCTQNIGLRLIPTRRRYLAGLPVFRRIRSFNASGVRVSLSPILPILPMPPILDNKQPGAPSLFEPRALLREARRQKGLPAADVPPICVLDPDGDIVRRLKEAGLARRSAAWPCYHTDLYSFPLAGQTAGIIGCAVGAPFAVLVAEQLFACGCRTLISVTSAGQIVPASRPPYFVIIDRALRDEGTSYHYAAPSAFAEADPDLVALAMRALKDAGLPAFVGASWTTDAPFRETDAAIAAARAGGVLAVEMEAAALYAFSRERNKAVLCLAQVTNTMGLAGEDFEKGEAQGTTDALLILDALASALSPAEFAGVSVRTR